MHRELTMRCSICEALAEVIDGSVVRSCAHSDAPVIADMEAVAYGIATLAQRAAESADNVARVGE